MVLRQSNEIVGSCGFKGPPTPDGIVEIAYSVEPDHRGNGYATEAAQALVSYAFSQYDVSVVWAHTLPESNASTQVLTKCEFRQIGEVMDPDDGLVWRWERQNEAWQDAGKPLAGAKPQTVVQNPRVLESVRMPIAL
jgi:RimJ/RimL family protein N-acetyltransferase